MPPNNGLGKENMERPGHDEAENQVNRHFIEKKQDVFEYERDKVHKISSSGIAA